MGTDRKQQIIECSLDILLNQGVGKLTIKNIAGETGFVESALYKHFSGKDEILNAIIQYVEEICEKVLQDAQSIDSGAIVGIKKYFSAWTAVYIEKPFMIPVLFSKELFKGNLLFSQKLQEVLQKQNDFIEEIIRRGQKRGEFPRDVDVQELRLIITSPAVLVIDSWFYSNMSFPLWAGIERILNTVSRLLFSGSESGGPQ